MFLGVRNPKKNDGIKENCTTKFNILNLFLFANVKTYFEIEFQKLNFRLSAFAVPELEKR